MDFLEYQAKEMLDEAGVPSALGKIAKTVDEAYKIAKEYEKTASLFVLKSQIHAGGRGKGVFSNGFKGGVTLCHSSDEVREKASKMLGFNLVTKQTKAEGECVDMLYVTKAKDIQSEFYLSFLTSREKASIIIIASKEGGVNIEEVAEKSPECVLKEEVLVFEGMTEEKAKKVAHFLGLCDQEEEFISFIKKLYTLYLEKDFNMLEINPLILTEDGRIVALDAKISADDNAIFRHPEFEKYIDSSKEDPREVLAKEVGLNYIGLDGNIGCMVNGAGLAMATMDIIQHFGGMPANFLDVGGGANEDQVSTAFSILMSDPQVKVIFINIFGGIMRCDIIAEGIIGALSKTELKVPLVVRLEGTNVKIGKKVLEEAPFKINFVDDLGDAAKKSVELLP